VVGGMGRASIAKHIDFLYAYRGFIFFFLVLFYFGSFSFYNKERYYFFLFCRVFFFSKDFFDSYDIPGEKKEKNEECLRSALK
jgi:hypothetical protein